MNERMLEMGVEDSQAWHKQYKDSAYVFIGKTIRRVEKSFCVMRDSPKLAA